MVLPLPLEVRPPAVIRKHQLIIASRYTFIILWGEPKHVSWRLECIAAWSVLLRLTQLQVPVQYNLCILRMNCLAVRGYWGISACRSV